ncbi:TMEM165/GDT1 family protein [Chitinivibrio alkaliphilus]|uniref:GDT1 family protein n=1 Tax=Chitinivibrio alkaliphilus ACht1 TaxID=1313304 RepID=U7DB48_9BACT|nr:TMEM165/GDT1 family protein [Chitinivibrio alkaliphilus]ERP39257.1 hypothetical protein CALK_0048 [Chitinivibrio alkaliphilus ACht1]
MDWKIFISTFGLIFLAELGDKTQFAIMAATASRRSILPVFLGASLALVLSTLVAIAAGTLLRRFVPDSALQIAAGVLFLIFGAVILLGALRGEPAEEEAFQDTAPALQGGGVVERSVLYLAENLESEILASYEDVRARVDSPEIEELLSQLIEEETSHLSNLSTLSFEGTQHVKDLETHEEKCILEEQKKGTEDGSIAEILQDILQKEHNIYMVYRSLSRKVKIESVRHVMKGLAEEEKRHIVAVEDMISHYKNKEHL